MIEVQHAGVFVMKAAFNIKMSRYRAHTGIAVVIIILICTGCAEHAPLRFAPKGITRVSYNPRNCEELPDGRFKCKEVIFTTAMVDVSKGNK
jgi:hypothetical protein